mgnify:CR=1 FL=1
MTSRSRGASSVTPTRPRTGSSAVVSHELRTPLTAMLGWVRLLTTGMLDDATSARALPVIERNTKLLAQLIDDLLDVSGIVAGKLRLEVGPVDLVAVIESAIESVQGLADAKSIGLKAVLDPSAGVDRRRPRPPPAGGVEPSSRMRSSSLPAADASTFV